MTKLEPNDQGDMQMSGLSDVQRGALKSCLEELYFGYGEKDWERLAGEATERIASAVRKAS